MSLLERYAREWLQSLEEIEAGDNDPLEACGRCKHDPNAMTQLEQNILADLRRVFAPTSGGDIFITAGAGGPADPGAVPDHIKNQEVPVSVNVYLRGLKEPTAEYSAKLKAYQACHEAGVKPPAEVLAYFDGLKLEYVPTEGMEVEIREAITGRAVEYGDGVTIDLSKLPPGVTRIRVFMQ